VSLVLQIALGIVLGFLILYFLPYILTFGVIAIIVVIALLVAGGLIYWIWGNTAAILVIATGIVSFALYHRYSPKGRRRRKINELKRSIAERSRLGYDTTELMERLLIEDTPFDLEVEKEKIRRKALGYHE
jgi:membrane protein implicated in regulation of membrane protease activity